ncbi:uncharacterized protein LOC143020994 isoform X3 [Oratosquilla oratoria]|uniref:uncharacterized protein LOC143020994 isoform X3 n=1 Tax=Oratosquilla oratoria TaxID=337810 RepID=UPI003F76A223
MDTCIYCTSKNSRSPGELLRCGKCQRLAHSTCLRSGIPPGQLEGDNFFEFTCQPCAKIDTDIVFRANLSITQLLLLTLYNLHMKNPAGHRKGFFHWELDIYKFIVQHWNDLFRDNGLGRKEHIRGIILAHLSQYPHFFAGGHDLVNDGGWYKLCQVLPPAVLLHQEAQKKKDRNTNQGGPTNKKARFEEVKVKEEIKVEEDHLEDFTEDVHVGQADMIVSDLLPPPLEESLFTQKKTLISNAQEDQEEEDSIRKKFPVEEYYVIEDVPRVPVDEYSCGSLYLERDILKPHASSSKCIYEDNYEQEKVKIEEEIKVEEEHLEDFNENIHVSQTDVMASDLRSPPLKESLFMQKTHPMPPKRKQQVTQQEIDEILAESDSEDEEIFGKGSASQEAFTEEDEAHDDDLEFEGESEEEDINDIPSSSLWQYIRSDWSTSPKTVDGVGSYNDTHRVVGLENCTPFQCFQKIFPDKIYEHVANETNKYAIYMIKKKQPLPRRSPFHAWTDVSVGEIKAFIAIEMAMGLVRKPSLRSYFAKLCLLTETPGFGSILSIARYKLIRSCLHFVDNKEKKKDDRLYKIRPILNIVKGLYTEVYISNKEVSVAETMFKFKRRLFWKWYLPPKKSSAEWGIKVWSLCDARTGYLLKFEVYAGKTKDLNTNVGAGELVVMKLLEEFENKGHVVYMDNFFSGVQLFQKLLKRKTGACGTVCPNRRGLPSEMKKIKKKNGEAPTFWRSQDRSMIAYSWQDSGRFNMLSTVGDTSTIQTSIRSKEGDRVVDKPSLQKQYNRFVGGVDLFDQLCASYPFNHRSKKWYHSIWHFIIEIALINSSICYNIQNKKSMSQVFFRQKIINGLLEGISPTVRKRRRHGKVFQSQILNEGHYIGQYEDKKYRPFCKVCSITPSQCAKRGKGECKRRQTSFFCKQCPQKPPLCITPCFEIFHTVRNYRKTCQCNDSAVNILLYQ